MRQRSEPGPGTGGSWRAPTEKGQRSPSFALEKKLEEHGAHVDDPNEGGDANFTRMVTRPLDGDHFPHPLEDRGVAYSLPTPPVMLLLQLLLQLLRVQRSCAPVLLGTLRLDLTAGGPRFWTRPGASHRHRNEAVVDRRRSAMVSLRQRSHAAMCRGLILP